VPCERGAGHVGDVGKVQLTRGFTVALVGGLWGLLEILRTPSGLPTQAQARCLNPIAGVMVRAMAPDTLSVSRVAALGFPVPGGGLSSRRPRDVPNCRGTGPGRQNSNLRRQHSQLALTKQYDPSRDLGWTNRGLSGASSGAVLQTTVAQVRDVNIRARAEFLGSFKIDGWLRGPARHPEVNASCVQLPFCDRASTTARATSSSTRSLFIAMAAADPSPAAVMT